MIRQRFARRIAWAAGLVLVGGLMLPTMASAKTPAEIDAGVEGALSHFRGAVAGADALLRDAQAVLVFPSVVQAGFGLGGEFGEGALREHGQDTAYYSLGQGSFGFQLGAQVKDIIIVFLQREALESFRAANGWTVGVDGSVVLINLGANASVNTTTYNAPVVAFVVGQTGLMYNLSLQGTKISRIHPH
jgi:lipid-binding SYLF domain-containing protein